MSALKARKPLVAGVGVGFLALLVLVVMVMPKMSQVGKQQKALDAAVADGQKLTTQVAELQDAKRAAASVKKQLERLGWAIPKTAALPRLIHQVQSIADASAVDFVQVSPSAPSATSNSYSTIPTQITTTGSYFAVTEFLYRLETLPRAVKVTGLTLGPGPDGLAKNTDDIVVTRSKQHGESSLTEEAAKAVEAVTEGAASGAVKGIKKGFSLSGGDKK